MTDRNKPPAAERSFTVWAPTDLIAQIDTHLTQLAAQHAPGRFSRQGWILALVRAALDSTTSHGAAIATHRARLAEMDVEANQTGAGRWPSHSSTCSRRRHPQRRHQRHQHPEPGSPGVR